MVANLLSQWADAFQKEEKAETQPARRSGKSPPSKNRQDDIITAIRLEKMPLQWKEIQAALRWKKPGSLRHDLSWMKSNGILLHIQGQGYWPIGDPLPPK